MKWTGSKFVADRPLEEIISLICAELDGIEGLKYEARLEPTKLADGLVIIEVLAPREDSFLRGRITKIANAYNRCAHEPENDIWDMRFHLMVRPKPPMTA